jgi:hypothetical protein
MGCDLVGGARGHGGACDLVQSRAHLGHDVDARAAAGADGSLLPEQVLHGGVVPLAEQPQELEHEHDVRARGEGLADLLPHEAKGGGRWRAGGGAEVVVECGRGVRWRVRDQRWRVRDLQHRRLAHVTLKSAQVNSSQRTCSIAALHTSPSSQLKSTQVNGPAASPPCTRHPQVSSSQLKSTDLQHRRLAHVTLKSAQVSSSQRTCSIAALVAPERFSSCGSRSKRSRRSRCCWR